VTQVSRRGAGWLGVVFVVLLFASAGMVALPATDEARSVIAAFYATNRAVILVAQVVGLLAAPVFVAFVFGFQRSVSIQGSSDLSSPIAASGLLVALVSVATALPVIVLAINPDAPSFWIRMTDLSDAVLFLTMSVFCVAAATRGARAPKWLRAGAVLTGLVTLARSAAGVAGVTSLDAVAPLAFVLFIVAASVFLLARHSSEPPDPEPSL